MKIMRVKNRWCDDMGRLGYSLNRHIANRFLKNKYTHIQLNGKVVEADLMRVPFNQVGVFFKPVY